MKPCRCGFFCIPSGSSGCWWSHQSMGTFVPLPCDNHQLMLWVNWKPTMGQFGTSPSWSMAVDQAREQVGIQHALVLLLVLPRPDLPSPAPCIGLLPLSTLHLFGNACGKALVLLALPQSALWLLCGNLHCMQHACSTVTVFSYYWAIKVCVCGGESSTDPAWRRLTLHTHFLSFLVEF